MTDPDDNQDECCDPTACLGTDSPHSWSNSRGEVAELLGQWWVQLAGTTNSEVASQYLFLPFVLLHIRQPSLTGYQGVTRPNSPLDSSSGLTLDILYIYEDVYFKGPEET